MRTSHDGIETKARLGENQASFARALLDPSRAVPAGLIGPDGKSSTKRFNVYRNNVVAGLTATLRDAFPATARIVGEEFFAAMARIHVADAPPASPMMLDYGAGFPDFIAAFEPASSLPYLPDVARIERAWVESYHAGEAEVLDPALLSGLAPDELPHLRLMLHLSLRLVRSRFPALTIWRMNIQGGVPGPVSLGGGGENILVARPDAEVELRTLPPGGAEFIAALSGGRPVIGAMKAASIADHRFNLLANLSGLIASHVLVGFEPAPRETKEKAR